MVDGGAPIIRGIRQSQARLFISAKSFECYNERKIGETIYDWKNIAESSIEKNGILCTDLKRDVQMCVVCLVYVKLLLSASNIFSLFYYFFFF